MPVCSLTCRLSAPYGAPALSLGGAFGSRPAPVKRAARCFVESSRLAPRCLASSYSHSCSVVITYMVPHRLTPWMRNQRFCITAGGWCRAGEGPCTCPEAGRDSFVGGRVRAWRPDAGFRSAPVVAYRGDRGAPCDPPSSTSTGRAGPGGGSYYGRRRPNLRRRSCKASAESSSSLCAFCISSNLTVGTSRSVSGSVMVNGS